MSDSQENQPVTQTESSNEIAALINVGHQFIELQGKQVEVKIAEIEANKAIALASIEAQKEISSHDRSHEGGQELRKYIFITVVLLIVIGLIFGLAMMGLKEMVYDILKIVLGFVAGMFYGISQVLKKNNEEKE